MTNNDKNYILMNYDCLTIMKTIPNDCIDTIITDPPYGLNFMGKKWDYDVPGIEIWKECLRVLKPGGTALIFAGSRTQHRMACNVEDAGFILKDCIMYLYGSGFPKATDIKKQLEKKYGKQKIKYNLRLMSETNLQKTINIKDKQGKILFKGLQEQSVHRTMQRKEFQKGNENGKKSCMEGWCDIQASQRELQRCETCALSEKVYKDGKEGWICNGTPFNYGTASWESVAKNRSCSSHRPQSEQQLYQQSDFIPNKPNSQEIREWNGWKSHGLKPAYEPILVVMKPNEGSYADNALKHGVSGLNIDGGRIEHIENQADRDKGRFPANLILDEEAGKMLDEQSGELKSGHLKPIKTIKQNKIFGKYNKANINEFKSNSGGASRFFYCAKASKSERNMGCESLPDVQGGQRSNTSGQHITRRDGGDPGPVKNNHPTVKPLKLMEYLCTLTETPTKGIVLDPFMGSGTTGIACKKTGRKFIGIEREKEYIEIAKKRIEAINNDKS